MVNPAAAVNQASGTVTRVVAKRGQFVDAGDVLYRVDERPVVVLHGGVPAFRRLGPGTTGADVQQLTRFLKEKGFLASVSSKYTTTVGLAVKAWQRGLGVPATGVVEQGDVLFVRSLPMLVALDSKAFAVGAHVASGSQTVERLATAPTFVASFNDTQAREVEAGMPVTVTDGSHTWAGKLGALKVADDHTISSVITGADGDSLCGTQCRAVPVEGLTQLQGEAQLQAPVAGIVVPVAALVSNADGSTAVVGTDGSRISVTVTAQARGMAVVTGLAVGTRVRVPGR